MDNAAAHRQKEQFLAARISIAGSITLFLISAVIGLITDSITLIIDASASLVILVVSFLMCFSIKKIHQPPDELYNFGYHKYEPLTATIQNGLIIVICVVGINFAIQDILHSDDMHDYGLPAIGIFCEAIIGLCIAIYLKITARKTHSQMIKASSFHWFLDATLSAGLCIGFCAALLAQDSGWSRLTPYFDPVMAILLSLFFISMTAKGGLHNLFELLDAMPVSAIKNKVAKIANEHTSKSLSVDRLRIRKAGQQVFIDVCFLADTDLVIAQVSEMADCFEKDLKVHFPNCDVVVRFKPRNTKNR